ncbi:Ubiquitin domain-containing protein UBFD1 [Geodia barretti]|uniref:Ubiquitin domain-containing protein UBFD1 n=1 Tax=Geodia barretti TaxID=519541 RepID=A0AA35SUD1_GEOBA|nr:Ubiquitin domain-containing protein UBFD1 [Geodia barretti]
MEQAFFLIRCTDDKPPAEELHFRVVWKKKIFEVSFGAEQKVAKLKEHIQTLTGIPPAMMKLMYKGLLRDEKTLREAKIANGVKMMVVGSTVDDVLTIQPPDPKELKTKKTEHTVKKEALSEMKEHKRLIEKGRPDDVPPGFRFRTEPLPPQPLSGMLNKHGNKVRLHFKTAQEELWIGTKERTEKIPIASIRTVVSEQIKDDPDYHIMGLQLGPTELSRYWIYWVPAQYVEAIKEMILGKWQI